MTLFGVAALLAPVVGPTLGGYITDNYGWRWIFYLNIPVGLIALIFCSQVVSDPEYLKVARAKARREPGRFDTIGLCLLSVTMVCWEVVLSKGQEWDWFGDPFWRVQRLSILFAICLGALIFRELRIKAPLINFRTLKDRNFRACCIIIACAFGVLYANTTTLPALLQSLFGYDAADLRSLVLSPSGIFAVITLLVVGIMLDAKGSTRDISWQQVWSYWPPGNFWMSLMNLDISPWQVVWPRVRADRRAFHESSRASLNVAAFLYIPPGAARGGRRFARAAAQ